MKPTLQFCAEPVLQGGPSKSWKQGTAGRNVKPALHLNAPVAKGRPLSAVQRPSNGSKVGANQRMGSQTRDKFKSPATQLMSSHDKPEYRRDDPIEELNMSHAKSVNIHNINNISINQSGGKPPSVAKLKALT